MEHPEIDRVELLRGLEAEERARCLFEWGLVGDPDPQIEELSRLAETGPGEWSWRLGPDCKPPKRTQDQYLRELRFERIGGKATTRRRPEPEELPGTSHVEQPPEGDVRDPSPSIAGRGDWVSAGVRAHLARMKAREGKPNKPFANEPEVTKKQAAANTGNPFIDVKATRSSRLRVEEVARVYDAMAFMRHAYQRRMNAHLTIRWSAMGVDEADARNYLDKFLNQAGKWFTRNKATQSCVWRDLQQLSDELLWVYVQEKSATYGFHTHVLLSLDVTQSKAFAAWVDGCLARLVRRQTVPGDTAFLSKRTGRSEYQQDRAHWSLCRYVSKQLDPDASIASPFCDKIVPAREVFEPWHLRADMPTTVMRLVGVCRRLDRGAQDKARYVSPLRQGLMLYEDNGSRVPCLIESDDRGCPMFGIAHRHGHDYPGLDLTVWTHNEGLDVTASSDFRYLAFETAWDRLTAAEHYLEASDGGKNEAAAGRFLAEARTNFAIAEGVINLDRWGLMPHVVYYEEAERPKLRFRRSHEEWDEQLSQSNLKADAAYQWYLQHVSGRDVVGIVPRQKMLVSKRRARPSGDVLIINPVKPEDRPSGIRLVTFQTIAGRVVENVLIG